MCYSKILFSSHMSSKLFYLILISSTNFQFLLTSSQLSICVIQKMCYYNNTNLKNSFEFFADFFQ